MNESLSGWPEVPQQTTQNQTPGYYRKLREISQMPFKEKVEASFQINAIVWGYTNILFVALLVGAVFHKHVWDFLKSRGFNITIGRKDTK